MSADGLPIAYRRRGEGIGRVIQLLAFVFLAWVVLSLASRGGWLLVAEMAVVMLASLVVGLRLLRSGSLVADSTSIEVWRALGHRKLAWTEVARVEVTTRRRLGGVAYAVPIVVLRSGEILRLDAAAERLDGPGDRSAAVLARTLESLRASA